MVKTKLRVLNNEEGWILVDTLRKTAREWNAKHAKDEGYSKRVSVYGRLGKNNNPNKIRSSRIPLDIAKDIVIYVTNKKS